MESGGDRSWGDFAVYKMECSRGGEQGLEAFDDEEELQDMSVCLVVNENVAIRLEGGGRSEHWVPTLRLFFPPLSLNATQANFMLTPIRAQEA